MCFNFFTEVYFSNLIFLVPFFLTKGTTASQLNRIFWLGDILLYSYGFEVILVCCDGASTNRTFYTMNTNNQLHSEGSNPFTVQACILYVRSTAPDQKITTQLVQLGFKEKHRRFTRTMKNNGKHILWEHVNDVYTREKRRSLYVTGLHCSHQP